MDLKTLLATHPRVFLYDRDRDEKEAFKIFESVPMRLPGFHLIYDRSPEFTALLKARGPHHLTFVARSNTRMLGFASISWGERFVNGEKKIVSYISDLRIIPDKEALVLWKKFYPDLLKFMNEELQIDFHLTAILADNKFALKSLVNNPLKNNFIYHGLGTTTMVNVLGTKPFQTALAENGSFEKIPVTALSSEIIKFMNAAETEKLFGQCLEDGEWHRRLHSWQGLASSSAYVYSNSSGIRGVCVPWSVSSMKRMKVDKMQNWARFTFIIPRLLGFSVPQNGQDLKVPYLTHLTFASDATLSEKARILIRFMLELKKEAWARKATFISFDDSWGIHSSHEFKRFFLNTTGVNFYGVTLTGESLPETFKNQKVGFDMSLA